MPEPLALDKVTDADFGPHVGTDFALPPEEGIESRVTLTLIEVTPSIRARENARRAFSLLFAGPSDVIILQGMYPLAHPALGTLDIFLVPISGDAERRTYEAVFA